MPLEEGLWELPDDMIRFKSKGDFDKTTAFFKRIQDKNLEKDLQYYGEKGVDILCDATPKDTGETASSWYYKVITTKSGIRIEWCNSNLAGGVPIAVLLQYGHGTGTGGYVVGVDYINPAMQPLADEISEFIRKELCAN